ncbi:spore germination protein [Caldifermentibacillus hisashii]|uniref:spore germination protein n=1 Tax=Bacillaceae TaxID=186817 RepID=UPI00203DA209|nr:MULTISPECIES: spore germination protein [Bacillaceae]MCM3055038.1 spore germination protein [Caldibacillus thermoamylovorans]MCM3476657.1 spore germination protein [Caldibacillus thermoamylovorans]MEC5273842.1 spore germination protein [Caldifermentibacillus hisashii]MED4851891.1 spore germination protein [Caldifermentibacillus hisashii]
MQTKKKKTTSQTNLIDLLAEKLEPSFDIINQKLQTDNITVHLLYLKTVVDNDQIQNYIIKPFFEMGSIQLFDSYIASLPQNNKIETNEKVLSQLSRGSVLVQIQEQNYLLDLKKITTNLVLETNIEPTIQGPELGLSEDIQTNLNIIRHRYHNISLKIETHQIGTSNNQTLAILYDQENVNDSVLKNLQEKVKNLKHSVILSSSELQRLLNDKKWTFMPIMMITERSDRVIQNIAGGKVVLILDGTPNAIIAPSVFFDFMTSMDDKYLPFGVSKFLKVLRYFGLFICLLLPGVYVAVTSYNPEVLRSELAFSVAGSRVGVPFPSFIEVLFLLVFMELLTEASIRLPRAVSGTATTVGGLILGTAATEAALTSNIMVIIVSAVAIATFAIPINEMSFAIRIVRYVLLFFGTTAGITGLILSFLAFVLYLTNLESFGEPYLKLFVQRKKVETKGVKS